MYAIVPLPVLHHKCDVCIDWHSYPHPSLSLSLFSLSVVFVSWFFPNRNLNPQPLWKYFLYRFLVLAVGPGHSLPRTKVTCISWPFSKQARRRRQACPCCGQGTGPAAVTCTMWRALARSLRPLHTAMLANFYGLPLEQPRKCVRRKTIIINGFPSMRPTKNNHYWPFSWHMSDERQSLLAVFLTCVRRKTIISDYFPDTPPTKDYFY